MSDVQKCLSAFTVAIWSESLAGIKLADKAIDTYLEPHIEAGTARDALEMLQASFRNVKRESVVADAIRIDLKGRIRSFTELVPS